MIFLSLENSNDILALLTKQIELIDSVYENQKKIRSAMLQRDWELMEISTSNVNKYSEEFQGVDSMLQDLLKELNITTSNAFYSAVTNFGKENKEISVKLIESYNLLRRKLIASEVENKALTDYVRITNQFMQGVFDQVIPQRKNAVYSRKGALVKKQPGSVVVNTIM